MPTCSSTACTHHRRPARRRGPCRHPSPAAPGTQNADPASADRHAAAGSALPGALGGWLTRCPVRQIQPAQIPPAAGVLGMPAAGPRTRGVIKEQAACGAGAAAHTAWIGDGEFLDEAASQPSGSRGIVPHQAPMEPPVSGGEFRAGDAAGGRSVEQCAVGAWPLGSASAARAASCWTWRRDGRSAPVTGPAVSGASCRAAVAGSGKTGSAIHLPRSAVGSMTSANSPPPKVRTL